MTIDQRDRTSPPPLLRAYATVWLVLALCTLWLLVRAHSAEVVVTVVIAWTGGLVTKRILDLARR